MEIYDQPDDVAVFGVHVKTFPSGIKEAFGGLIKAFGNNRSYYGISWFDENGSIKYYAMAPEAFKGEAKKYDHETLVIEKGRYYTETIHNWLSKTDSIKGVFHRLRPNSRPDKSNPCIEWYKSDEEMLCMFRAS